MLMKIQSITEKIVQKSTGRIALGTLLLFVIFTAVVLPNQAAQSETYASEVGSPDQSLVYGPEDIYRMAEAYGPDGRQAYIRARFTFDLVWPLVYLIFLAACLGWLAAKLFPPFSRWRTVVMLPFLGSLFDYAENISAAVVMSRYPALSPLAASTAPIFTLFKWSAIGLSFALILWFLVRLVFSWRRRRSTDQAG